jgi:carboxypeptidase D
LLGFELSRRANYRGRDLNRNFPDLRFPGRETGTLETETSSVMAFCKAHHFVLSVSFHGGSVVANYPYDGNFGYRSGVNEPSVDDDVFRHLCLVYSNAHTTMHLSTEFHNGITNGAEWYVLYGGMQDWNYVGLGTMELTLEISDDKYPPANTLPTYWTQNKEAMLALMEQTHTGLRGVVTDAVTGAGLEATITVSGRKAVKADPAFGNYYKLLRPGTYSVTVTMPGYATKVISPVVIPSGQQIYNPVELNVAMTH